MSDTPRDLLSVKQFAEKHPAFTQNSLRALIFNSEYRLNSRGDKVAGNGLSPAIFRMGRKVLISESLFFAWLGEQQKR